MFAMNQFISWSYFLGALGAWGFCCGWPPCCGSNLFLLNTLYGNGSFLTLLWRSIVGNKISPIGSSMRIKVEPHRILFLGEIFQYSEWLPYRFIPIIMGLVLIFLELDRMEICWFNTTFNNKLRSILQIIKKILWTPKKLLIVILGQLWHGKRNSDSFLHLKFV